MNVDANDEVSIIAAMHTITFCNPKGGTGKTTAALILAEQLHVSGLRVGILDLDHNANIVSWDERRAKEGRGRPFRVLPRPPMEEVVATIDAQADELDFLIVDLEGSRDQITTYALSRTDLCLIPLDGSMMEAVQAASAVKLIQSVERMLRRLLKYALLFTRSNAAFMSADERDVRADLEHAALPILDASLMRRSAYTQIFRDGKLLTELIQDSKSLRDQERFIAARTNASLYSSAVVRLLEPEGNPIT